MTSSPGKVFPLLDSSHLSLLLLPCLLSPSPSPSWTIHISPYCCYSLSLLLISIFLLSPSHPAVSSESRAAVSSESRAAVSSESGTAVSSGKRAAVSSGKASAISGIDESPGVPFSILPSVSSFLLGAWGTKLNWQGYIEMAKWRELYC